MNFEVYWEDNYVGRFENGVCVEQVFHNTKLDFLMGCSAEELLSSRVFPEVRWNDELREFYGLEDYSPLEICKLTHGYMKADFMWLKFPEDSDNLNWEEVQLQLF